MEHVLIAVHFGWDGTDGALDPNAPSNERAGAGVVNFPLSRIVQLDVRVRHRRDRRSDERVSLQFNYVLLQEHSLIICQRSQLRQPICL